MRRSTRFAHALAALMLLPVLARADGAVDRARELFEAGARAYEAGRYPEAVQALEQAQRLLPRPAILFSIAQAERKLFVAERDAAVLRSAIAHYREYLQREPKGARRVDAIDALAELEPLATRVELPAGPRAQAPAPTRVMISSKVPGAVASLDGRDPLDLPLIEVVAPGKHTVRLSAEGFFQEEREIVAIEGTLVPLDVSLRERPATLLLVAPAGAELLVDGRLVGSAPSVSRVDVAAGTHVFAALRSGAKPFVVTVTLERGETKQLLVSFERSEQRTVAWTFFIAGDGLMLAAAAFGVYSYAKQVRARSILNQQNTQNISVALRDEYNAAIETRDTMRTVAGSLAVGAGVLFGVGAVMYFLDQPVLRLPTAPGVTSAGSPRELSLGPWLSGGATGAVVGGRF